MSKRANKVGGNGDGQNEVIEFRTHFLVQEWERLQHEFADNLDLAMRMHLKLCREWGRTWGIAMPDTTVDLEAARLEKLTDAELVSEIRERPKMRD
jgi:hypothetical protein